jgi:hypothetical protein
MKHILLILFIIVTTGLFTSCKKKPPTPVASIHGLWKAKYSLNTTSNPDQDVIYLITDRNKIFVYNGADTATAKDKGESSEMEIASSFVGVNGFGAIYTYYNSPTTTFYITVKELNNNYTNFEGVWGFISNGNYIETGKIIGTKVN